MEDMTKQVPATIDDIRTIVEAAVQQAMKPLESRIESVERDLQGKVSADVAQRMIDASFGGLDTRIREVHRLELSLDEHLRTVEAAFQRVDARLESVPGMIDKIEKRVNELDNRLEDAEGETRSQRIALYGDPTKKDAPPSLYALIVEMPERFKDAIAPLAERVAAIEAENKDTRQFVTRRRLIEKRFVESATGLIKNPMLVKVLVGLGGAVGIGTFIAELLKILAGGTP